MNLKKLIRNFSYALSSNLIALLISTLILLIVPKIIGVTEYGYFQLFIFYTSYIGFFHFGWCDGIYLRYGGKRYKELDKAQMSAQFWLLTITVICICFILTIFLYCSAIDVEKQAIFFFIIICIVFYIPKTMISYILQVSNRMKAYSMVMSSEKISYFILVLIVVLIGFDDYKMLVFAFIAGIGLSLFLAIYLCKDIVFTKPDAISRAVKEAYLNLNAGSKLMLANIAGLLIIGVIRLAIESHWSIETFGKISLSLSISNMLMIFINAVGIVIFPLLKRCDVKKMRQLYFIFRNVLMLLIFGMMLFYYPINYLLNKWLLVYSESLRYLVLLFPICVYESKMSMLINTYLKALRKERMMLLINVLMVVISTLLSIVNVYIFDNLELTILSIVIVFALRCFLAEMVLMRKFKGNIIKDILLENGLCLIFIVSGWYLQGILAFFIYLMGYLAYIMIKYKDIILDVQSIRRKFIDI